VTVSAEETNKNFNVAEMMQRYQSPEQKVLAALDAIVTTLKNIETALVSPIVEVPASEPAEQPTFRASPPRNRKGK
jgi:hypothetical protein